MSLTIKIIFHQNVFNTLLYIQYKPFFFFLTEGTLFLGGHRFKVSIVKTDSHQLYIKK